MIRRRAQESKEVASIIQEIVIYDKPNKPTVPDTILSQSRSLNIGQGDIIIKGNQVKDEPQEISDSDNEEPIIPDPEEPLVDDLNDLIHRHLEEQEDVLSEEESIENISKEILKSTFDSKNKEKKRKQPEAKSSPFKKPKTQPKKSLQSSPQKNSLLKYFPKVEKESNNTVEKRTNCKIVSLKPQSDAIEITETPASCLNGERQKRVRRMPKKLEDEDIILDERSLGRYSSKEDISIDPSLKKKKYAELTIVPIYSTDTSTDEAADVMNKSDGVTGNKLVVHKRHDIEEQQEDDIEEMDSDEDSRKEWVPEEYAEYRRQRGVINQSNDKTDGKMFKCKFCTLQFGSYYGLRKHRALEHGDLGKERLQPGEFPEEEVQEIEGSDEESRGEWLPEDYAEYKMKHILNKQKRGYKCKICCGVFSNYYKLSKHRMEHQERLNPYKCKECGVSFGDVEALTAHLRMHQGKFPYTCRKCAKGFDTKKELVEHGRVHVLKKAAPAEKKYRCEICSKDFRKICDIERHTRVHTGEKPAECTICHKRFQQSHNLSKHLLTHLHVRPFQCEICNKKFGRIDVLNRHILTHSVEKPYKCQICAKGFIRQVQLNNHMDKNHTDALEEASVVTVTDEILVTPLGR